MKKNSQHGNGEKQETANPVPSLDNLLDKFLTGNYAQDVNTYHNFLKDKLQNGVETDNEQPRQCLHSLAETGDMCDRKCDCLYDERLG